MKETYLEEAQKEVFFEAKKSQTQYFAPSAGFIGDIKKDIIKIYDKFAKGAAEDLQITNPMKASELAEKWAVAAIKGMLAQDEDHLYEQFEKFKSVLIKNKLAKEK